MVLMAEFEQLMWDIAEMHAQQMQANHCQHRRNQWTHSKAMGLLQALQQSFFARSMLNVRRHVIYNIRIQKLARHTAEI